MKKHSIHIDKRNLLVAAMLLILLLPNLGAAVMASELSGRWGATAAYLAVSTVILLLPATVLRARAYFALEGAMTLLLSPIEWGSLYFYRQPTSSQLLNSIISTDTQEAAELLRAVWPAIVAFAAICLLYAMLASRMKNEYILPAVWRRGIAVAAVGLLAGIYGTMCVLAKRFHSDYGCKQAMLTAVDMTRMKLNKTYPLNIYRNAAQLYRSRQEWKEAQALLADFRFGIGQQAQDSALYVLFLGESVRYDHMQLCGYDRETTPGLSARGDIISFDSVYAPANTTQQVYPCLLTRATPGNMAPARTEKSLLEAFGEGGYSTAVISKNQGALLERIMANADYSHLFSRGFDAAANYDDDLLPQMRKALTDGPQMMTISSVGSHFCYSLRYPEEEAFFRPDFRPEEGYLSVSEESKQRLINAYDNSIRFTDKVLADAISWADSLGRPVVIVYLSDHGESFWDDARKLSLHGSYVTSEAEYHVPLLVWCSEEYIRKHPDKVEALKANTGKRICSSAIFATMADLAGIEEIAILDQSLSSPLLRRQDTLRVLNGAGDIVIFWK